jgi:hypothetical protein
VTADASALDADDTTVTDTTSSTVTVVEPSDETDPASAVSLSPSEATIGVDETTTFDVVVADADGGVGAIDATVALADSSVASITDLTVSGATNSETTDVTIAADGSSATVESVLLDTNDDGPVSVVTVTVTGDAVGSSDLSLTIDALGDESGTSYDVTDVTGASLTVVELGPIGDSANPPADLDGDGTFEDVNGDGTVDVLDVQVLFTYRDDETVANNPSKFDFNGDGTFDVVDVQALFANLP